MKRLLILLVLLALAPSITDQLNADFDQGTHQNTLNISNSVVLNQTNGTYVSSGIYISSVKDLGSNPTATISWEQTVPAQTSLLVTTRSGPTSTPDSSWSSWSSPYADPQGGMVTSPQRRYYQYRLQLATQDNATAPEVDAVTITYTEQGPQIRVAHSQNNDLTVHTQGDYRFYVAIEDTMTLTNTSARTRVAPDSFSLYQTLSTTSSYYYIDVPEPSGGWVSRVGDLLEVEVLAENNNTFASETFSVHVYQPPEIDVIANRSATEGQQLNISLSATGMPGQQLTFTSSHGTITHTSESTATLSWTPTSPHVGNTTVTIEVTDGQQTDQTTFTAFVEGFNFPPEMRPVSDQSGYWGDRIVFDIVVDDQNVGENMTYWVEPRLFRIHPIASNESNVYRARANFTALDDHRGVTNLTFYVSDGEHTDSQTALLDIAHCGDGVCHANENSTSCPQDCRQTSSQRSYVVIEVPDRFCVNQTATIHVYNASSRYSCFLDGRAFQGAAYCDRFQGVFITVYELRGQQRNQVSTLTSDAQGEADFTPSSQGRYRFVAEHDDMMSMDRIVTVNDCSLDISVEEEVIERERPSVPPPQRKPTETPQLERPDLTPEETSLLAILVWYIIIPLLGAALLYTSNAWYDINKDSNVYLLRFRVWLAQKQRQLAPKVLPPLHRAYGVVAPVVRPAVNHIYHGVLKPTGSVIRNVVERIRR